MKIYICKILYKNCRFKQIIFNKYATNLKTTICQRSLKNLGLLLLLFEFNKFSFLKDIIDNIITTSVSRDQNSHQWQCSIIVTWNRQRHSFISISQDRNIKSLLGLDQLLKCLGFSLLPISCFFYSPF